MNKKSLLTWSFALYAFNLNNLCSMDAPAPSPHRKRTLKAPSNENLSPKKINPKEAEPGSPLFLEISTSADYREALTTLQNSRDLQSLEITIQAIPSPQQITDLINLLPATLTTLTIFCFSDNFINSHAKAICTQCPNLKELNLNICPQLTAPTITSSELVTLAIVGSQNLTSPIIRCLNLKELTLNHSQQLTDAAVTAISQHCPNLEVLSLSCCHTLKKPIIYNVSLKTIGFSLCEELEDIIIEGPKVERLCLRSCPKLLKCKDILERYTTPRS